MGFGTLTLPTGTSRLNKLNGTTAPGVTDDASAGYSQLSVWFDTTASPHEAYICVDATAGAAIWLKTTLTIDELGSMAVQNSNAVTITGGSISGITDLAVADGGTGASTAADARTNLGVPSTAEAQALAIKYAIALGG